MLDKTKILGVDITNDSADNILEYIFQKIEEKKKFYIVTPNPEILVYASSHENFKKILNYAEISLPDGSGLFLASLFLLKPFRQRIPGVDFMEEICKRSISKPISIGLLGGKKGVAEKTAERLLRKYPGLSIVFIAEEWGKEGFVTAEQFMANGKWQMANGHTPRAIDILFVAFGHPKQEEWIYKNLDSIPVTAAMGVGGAFDYISGTVKRAPFLVRAVGFEFLYRLISQPWRWKRQLSLLKFVKLIIKERFANR